MADATTIYIVRHGETDANLYNMIQGQTDVPLNESGLKQAELVGRRLRNFPFDVIYSSDLSRAAVTAKNIAGEREVILTKELREWNLGAWQGKYLSDIAVEFADETKGTHQCNSSGFGAIQEGRFEDSIDHILVYGASEGSVRTFKRFSKSYYASLSDHLPVFIDVKF